MTTRNSNKNRELCALRSPDTETRWGIADAEINNPALVRAQGYQRFPLHKPVVGQNIVLHAVPADRASLLTTDSFGLRDSLNFISPQTSAILDTERDVTSILNQNCTCGSNTFCFCPLYDPCFKQYFAQKCIINNTKTLHRNTTLVMIEWQLLHQKQIPNVIFTFGE